MRGSAVILVVASLSCTPGIGLLSGPRPEADLCAGRGTTRCGSHDIFEQSYPCPTSRADVRLVYTLVNGGELPLEYRMDVTSDMATLQGSTCGTEPALVVADGRGSGKIRPFDSVELVITCRTEDCAGLVYGTGPHTGDYSWNLTSNDPRSPVIVFGTTLGDTQCHRECLFR